MKIRRVGNRVIFYRHRIGDNSVIFTYDCNAHHNEYCNNSEDYFGIDEILDTETITRVGWEYFSKPILLCSASCNGNIAGCSDDNIYIIVERFSTAKIFLFKIFADGEIEVLAKLTQSGHLTNETFWRTEDIIRRKVEEFLR